MAKKQKSVIRKSGEGYELFASGAPEEIFSMCSNVADDVRKN